MDRMSVRGEVVEWNGNEIQWSKQLAPRKTFEVRGFRGSIRALLSADESIHVRAQHSGAANVPVEIEERDNGIVICAGDSYAHPGPKRQDPASAYDVPVDFVVHVAAGVLFEASMHHGDIRVEKLQSPVTVATIEGNIRIQIAGFAAQANTIKGNVLLELPATTDADFYGSIVSGTLNSDFALVELPSDFPTPGPFLPIRSATLTHAPSRSPRIVQATIGQGGVALRATVVDGDVQLRRA